MGAEDLLLKKQNILLKYFLNLLTVNIGDCWAHSVIQIDFDESPVHPVIDEGVNTGLTHGQPVEQEVDVADIGDLHDGGVVVGVNEVDMVGGPANHKDENNQSEHQHHLVINKCKPLN